MTPGPHDSALRHAAARLGVDGSAPVLPLAFGHEGPLLADDDARLTSALGALLLRAPWPAAPAQAWQAPAAAALRAWLALPGRVALGSDPRTLLAAALQDIGTRSGRAVVLAIDPLVQRPASALPVARGEVTARLAKGDVAAVVFEPRVETPAERDELGAVLRQARALGVSVIADETRTAGRVHAGSSARALELEVDAILLGSAVAGGRAFAALLAPEGPDTVEATDAPDALALLLAHATAVALAQEPVAPALAAHGEAMRSALAAACARERITGTLLGPPALGRFRFPAQEGVPAPLLQWHFAAELERAGARASEWCVPHAGWAQIGDRLRRALDAAVGRLRTLLIENSSYLSGGLAYVFPGADEVLRQRGLGVYRYPKTGPVDVTAQGDRVRIAFARGPLGDIVSSGFFLQTRITGDFEVEAEYELLQWSPGPDSACLGLFFQNELSTGRYYAQRTIARDGSDTVHGSFDGSLTATRPARAPRGALRLARAGTRVSAWHRDAGGEWLLLGTTERATADDGIIGAKIWSKVACDGLVAEVSALRLVATLAREQKAVLGPRPDPRAR